MAAALASLPSSDLTGPLAPNYEVKERGALARLVGRRLRQLFGEVTHCGAIVAPCKPSKAPEYRGQQWVNILYEDGDTEQREVGELFENAELLPLAEHSKEELAACSRPPSAASSARAS